MRGGPADRPGGRSGVGGALRARPRRTTLLLGVPSGIHPDLRERMDALAARAGDRFDIKRWPGGTDRLVDAVVDGRLAMTLARLPAGGDPALEVLPVMSERLGAVLPRDRFEGRERVALAELAELSYVASPAAASSRAALRSSSPAAAASESSVRTETDSKPAGRRTGTKGTARRDLGGRHSWRRPQVTAYRTSSLQCHYTGP